MIATVSGAQDISQIEDMYGRSKKNALLSNLNNQFYGRVGHRETAQYVADLWGREYVQQRTEGQSESSRDFETTQGRSISHSYTERSRVRIQDVLELNTDEFYNQLVDSDFSGFKTQGRANEGGPLPEMVPVTLVTSQDVKQNFLRIQDEIGSLLHRQQPQPIAEHAPVETKTPPVNGHQFNGQSKRDERTSPGESLDF